MKKTVMGLVATFCLAMTLTSCQKEVCTSCSYTHPIDGTTATSNTYCDKKSEVKDWEDAFKEQVTTSAAEFADVEITCTRD